MMTTTVILIFKNVSLVSQSLDIFSSLSLSGSFLMGSSGNFLLFTMSSFVFSVPFGCSVGTEVSVDISLNISIFVIFFKLHH